MANRSEAPPKAMKLIALGESHVGKSCLIRRYTTDQWAPTFITTIGIDVQKVKREIEGRQYQLQIWDTAGQERFRSITLNYVHGAHGVLLVYDLTDRKTFEAVRVWAQRLNEMAGDRLALVVVGNKSDMCEVGICRQSHPHATFQSVCLTSSFELRSLGWPRSHQKSAVSRRRKAKPWQRN